MNGDERRSGSRGSRSKMLTKTGANLASRFPTPPRSHMRESAFICGFNCIVPAESPEWETLTRS